jgi:hypothetical protein
MKSAEAVHRGQQRDGQQPQSTQSAHGDWSTVVSDTAGGESSPLPLGNGASAGPFCPSAAAELAAHRITHVTIPNKWREIIRLPRCEISTLQGAIPTICIGPAIVKHHWTGKFGCIGKHSHRHRSNPLRRKKDWAMQTDFKAAFSRHDMPSVKSTRFVQSAKSAKRGPRDATRRSPISPGKRLYSPRPFRERGQG